MKGKDMKRVTAGVLDIAYLEVGPPEGVPVILLHGFPYDVHAYDEAAKYLVTAGRRCIIPFLRGYGLTRFLASDTPRSGQEAALGSDVLALMDALGIPSAVLAGYDWGGRAACVVATLWPDRVRGLVSCGTDYNIQNIASGGTPVAPEQEHRSWYMYYFNTERGRAGLTVNRSPLCHLIWRLFSPTWAFDDATFARTAVAFDNPDFVDVVIHSYRYRLGGIPGDPALQTIEDRLFARPGISVPSIALQGKDDGVDPPAPAERLAPHFTGAFQHRVFAGVGHNVPQEAPGEFAEAVLALG